MQERDSLALRGNPPTSAAKRLTIADGRYVTRGAPRSGGLASVYCAMDVEAAEMVALKLFRTGEGTDGVVEESFRREVQALTDLKHPNIIRIRGSGRDAEEAVHYIVMDWVEQDLKSYAAVIPDGASSRFPSWQSYYQVVGKPVLEALAFAHARAVVHRDIKPSNVLISADGDVKLCDFGISKIRNFLAPGITLAQFASAPFAPPEQDDGSHSYGRDVFGFAALSLAVLSGELLTTHEDVLEALERAPMEEATRQILRRCLSMDTPSLRPINAVLVMAELERASPVPAALQPKVLVVSTQRVRDILEADMDVRGVVAEQFLVRDLDGAMGEEIPPSDKRPDWSLRVYGGKYGYTVVREESGERLRLVDAVEFPPSELERKKGQSCELGIQWVFGVGGLEASRQSLDALRERLLVFSGDRKVRQLEEREQALYKTWLDLLSAKTELEKMRKQRLEYDKRDARQEFLSLTLKAEFDGFDLAEQNVTIDTGARGIFQGTVVKATSHTLLIRPSERNKVDMSKVPERGGVELDTTRSDVALDKQKSALEAVRYGRSVNPELGRLLVNPDQVPVPPQANVEFIQKHIDEDKKDAVLTALSEPALLLVEGPPGTGKTTFITELVLQTLRANPNARVLLTSQTHVALDNSLERIVAQSAGEVSAVRIGQESDERIAASTRKHLLDAKLPAMRKAALASGRVFMERRASEAGLSLRDIRKAMALEGHAAMKLRMELLESEIQSSAAQFKDEGAEAVATVVKAERDERFQGLCIEREDLQRKIEDSLKELATHLDSKEELNEFSECSAADLKEWAEAFTDKTPAGIQLTALLSAHADWDVRFGRSMEFKAALIASSQVVAGTCLGVMSVPGKHDITYDLCIVDEASIATPTEVLVPMSRSRRTVLVGDSKQLSPFQDPDLQEYGLLERYKLTPQDQKATLFNHLNEGLPAALKKTLSTQHRMLPAIGNMVSECFYLKQLQSVERVPLPYLKGALPRPVTWYSTSRMPRHASRRVGTSFCNDMEVEQIMSLLGRVDFLIQSGRGKGNRISVAVLTGYGAQRQLLQTSIQARQSSWSSFSEIYVNVVDAFQGREADMVIFSVTRSEERGLGFLREMERINVALSRAKELLAVVGDHAYCQMVPGAVNPLKGVIEYIRSNPDDCTLEELSK